MGKRRIIVARTGEAGDLVERFAQFIAVIELFQGDPTLGELITSSSEIITGEGDLTESAAGHGGLRRHAEFVGHR